jgi:4-alpha-glucanotransferase
MNQPGTVGFNWRWRLLPKQLTAKHAKEVRALTIASNRANWDAINAAEKTEEA